MCSRLCELGPSWGRLSVVLTALWYIPTDSPILLLVDFLVYSPWFTCSSLGGRLGGFQFGALTHGIDFKVSA